MRVELVETTTEDGLTLHGAYHPAPHSDGDRPAIDTAILLHGVGSNFYSSNLLNALSVRFSQRGLATLRVNTRGHDFVSLTRSSAGPQRQGAAYECVAHCHYDVSAWSSWLCDHGAHRIAVVGHSLGGVKALYSAALHPHHSTASVIAISPPRLSHASFAAGTRKLLFQRTMARAQEHMDSGKPETLMRVTYPLPMLITAAGYLEKYGPGEKFNLLRFVDRIRCPTLFAFGQQELESGSAAFAELPDQLHSLSSEPSALQSVTIAGANHDYQGCIEPLAVRLLDWLGSLKEGHTAPTGNSAGS